MKIFTDSSLKDQIENKILDLGTVLAGDTANYTFYVHNDEGADATDLVFSVDNKEVEILEYPKELKPDEAGRLVIKYSPSLTLKQGLRKEPLHIKGFLIYS